MDRGQKGARKFLAPTRNSAIKKRRGPVAELGGGEVSAEARLAQEHQ
jgi:hypothetical protein